MYTCMISYTDTARPHHPDIVQPVIRTDHRYVLNGSEVSMRGWLIAVFLGSITSLHK